MKQNKIKLRKKKKPDKKSQSNGPSFIALLTTTTKLNSKDGQFLITGSQDLVATHGPELAKVFEGRGGGRPGRYQGKGQSMDPKKRQEAINYLSQILASPISSSSSSLVSSDVHAVQEQLLVYESRSSTVNKLLQELENRVKSLESRT